MKWKILYKQKIMILFILYLNALYFYFSTTLLLWGFLFFIIFYWAISYLVKTWDKIITKKSHNFKREFFFTCCNFLIYFLISHICFRLYIMGYIQFDFSLSIFIPVFAILFIIGHDLYFYILHRVLHQKWMLKNVHYVHHQSHISSIWTSYSFHPIEWIMYTWVVLLIFLVPLNFFAFMLAVFYNDFLTILWHAGKENFSPRFLKSRNIFKYIATPSYHDLHHSRSKWNYGLYFLYLDKIFYTYDKKHKDIIS
jgi:sterol desaturase/sphingolipid hydroxylase (fatty acid hydroxylase superfamily)